MDIQPKLCSQKTIEQFLTDHLSQAELDAFESHLEDCPQCRARLENMAAEGAWWVEARGYLSSGTSLPEGSSGVLASAHAGEDLSEETAIGLYGIKNYLAPTDDPRMLGRLGGYEIMGVVGCGGMGVVLKAFEPPLNRYVAIKVLGPQLALSGAARQRFTREAKAAAAVVHDNVIAIHTIAEAGGLPYFVMPYLRGPSLERRLQRTGPLAVDEILRIGMQIARGLAAAHAQGLVHRDIKPANILLEEGVERVTITDFGLARAVDDASITRTGMIAGTPQYMSPEQAKGEFVDHRSDLFSLGSVLYALCSGRPPFRADSTLGVLRRVEEDDPRPIREINAQIPEWLAGLIERLHAKDPEDRLQSAEQVAGLLEGFLAHLRQPMTIAAPKLPPLRLSVQDEGTAKPTATEAARDLVSRYWKTLAKGRGIRLLLVALAPCLIACVLAVWLAESVRVLQGAPPIVESARAFYQDLRGSRQPAEPFVLAGPNAEAFVRPEPQGLRITLPAQRDKTDPVGIATSARIVGDFDITAGYEILSVQRPRTGAGVGFEFFVMTDTPTRNAIAFYRTARVREGDVYACGHNYQATTESKRIFDHTMTPTTCMSGHLRLIRTGSQITFLAAEGDSKDFRELRRCELGLDEIKMVRLAAYSGGVKAPVDIRLVDVNVQTTLPVAGLTATPPSGGSGAARGWLMAAGVIAVGVSLSFAGLWFFIRRNRGAEPPEQDSAAVEKPVEAEEKPVEAEVPSPSPFIMFPCSGCGKTLKVKAEWVGKKGKCSACGKESLVPGSPAEPAAVTVKAVRPARRMRTPAWITVPGLLLLAGIGAAFWYGMAGGGAPQSKGSFHEYHESFKGIPANSRQFEFFGPDSEECVKYEPDGLRITLPAGYGGERGAVGLATHIVAQGDFEITANFEILQEPSIPDAGTNGTRLSIMVGLQSPKQDVTRVTRAVRADSGTQFITWSSVWDNETRTMKPRYGSRPTSATTGRLRVVRTGPTLSYYVAEGFDKDFILLQEYPFTEADVRNISLVGSTSGPKAGLDVRFTDLHVRAKALPGLPGTTAQGSAGSDWPGAGSLIVLFIALSVSLAGWMYVSHPGPAIRFGSAGNADADSQSSAVSSGSEGFHRRLPQILWLSVLVLLMILGAQVVSGLMKSRQQAEAGTPLAESLHEELRSSGLKSNLFRAVGDGVQPEAEGVRITLPAGSKHPSSGLQTTGLTTRGDFEITTSFEILRADRPESGYGLGASLCAQIDGRTMNALLVARRVTPDGKTAFISDRMQRVNGNEQHRVRSIPTTATAGKLRLQRVGSIVHYLVAEGDSQDFVQVDNVEVGTDDIECIQIGGYTGGSEGGLDMRLLDFTVQAEELPGNPQAHTQVAWGRSLLLGLEFVGVLLVLSTAVWLSPHQTRADKKSLLTPLAAPPPGLVVTAINETPRGWLAKKWWLCGGLALIVPVIVCAWILWSQPPKPSSLLDITLGSQPVPGVKESGFSQQEYFKGLPIRWTDGDAQLVVPIDKTRPPQALQVQLRSHRLPGVKKVQLQIVANGQSLFDGAIGLGDWEKTFDLRNIPLGDQLTLGLKSDTFTPLGNTKLGGDGKEKSDDPRKLGVQVRGITLLPDLPARQRNLSGRKTRALPPAPVSIAPLVCGALSSDGKLVIAGARDGTIVFWDIAANRRRILPALSPNLLAIAINPTGNTFATASADRLIHVWDVATGQPRATLAGHAGEITALDYSADGKTLVSVGGERFRAGELKLWNLQTGKEQGLVEPFKVRLWSVAVAPDGKTAAVGAGDGTAYLVDMKSGKIHMSFPNPGYIRRIALSPDGKWLAAGYGDKGQVRIHGRADGKLRCDLQVPGGTYMEGLHFTGDSRRLFTACGEGGAVLWDFAKTPAVIATLPKDQTSVLPFALLLPDGRSFVTTGDKGLMRLLRFPPDFATRAMIDFLHLVNPRGEHAR